MNNANGLCEPAKGRLPPAMISVILQRVESVYLINRHSEARPAGFAPRFMRAGRGIADGDAKLGEPAPNVRVERTRHEVRYAKLRSIFRYAELLRDRPSDADGDSHSIGSKSRTTLRGMQSDL
jgi:hypothetical protein